jgi:threonine aldolase
MIFASDNWSGASDNVMAALTAAARTGGRAYGGDDLTRSLTERFSALFEREVAVFLVGTGTAANTLAIGNYARPGGVAFCHRHAHINVDEAGAAEAIGGLKLVAIDGRDGRYGAEALAATLARYPEGAIHYGQPVLASVSNITELGTAYQPEEIAAIATVAKGRGLAVHMDGARFAGAVASLGVAPADITWRAGVDVLSFGGTKNGCVAAEAVVFFDPAQARDFAYARQRVGHGFSKAWFIAAQFHAYLEGGHWLDLARHANAMGARLAKAIRQSNSVRLAAEPAANEIFAIMPKATEARLKAAGAAFNPWSPESLPEAERPGDDEVMVRLVTSFQTEAGAVDAFAGLLGDG